MGRVGRRKHGRPRRDALPGQAVMHVEGVCRPGGAQPVLKRVAAVAGDAIGLDGGGAIVNGSG